MIAGARQVSAGPLGALLGLALYTIPVPGAPAGVIAADDRQVIFEVRTAAPRVSQVEIAGRLYLDVELPNAQRVSAIGAPDLPWVEHMVALPPGTRAVATVLASDTRTLATGRVRPRPAERYERPRPAERGGDELLPTHEVIFDEDPAIYGANAIYPSAVVAAGAPERWRHYRIARIAVHPLRWDPSGGRLLWHTRIRVRVDFIADPGSRPATGERPYGAPEPRWEPLLKDRLLNYERARTYRRSPVAPRSFGGGLQEGATEFRLEVTATDLYAVAYDDLAARGDLTEPQPWNEIKLVVREHEDDAADPFREWTITYLPEDLDQDDFFGPGDALIFYGEDAWDFFDLAPGEKRYGRANVYWLAVGGGGGTAMSSESAWRNAGGLDPLLTFSRTLHFERNLFIIPWVVRRDNTSRRDPFSFQSDHYNWTQPDAHPVTGAAPFKVVDFDLPEISGARELRVHVQGHKNLDVYGGGYHQPRLWLSPTANVEGVLSASDTAWTFPGNPYSIESAGDIEIVLDHAALAGAPLSAGRNYLKIYVPTENDGIDNVNGNFVGINRVAVTYESLFWFSNRGRLAADLQGLSGEQQFNVRTTATGSARPDILAFDLTDPRMPAALELADSLFSMVGSNWWLRVQVDCQEASRAQELLFIERAAVTPLDADAIALRPAPPLESTGGADLVAVYPRRFAEKIEPLLTHREGQGHRVLRAPVEDVYDTFNGGRPHPYAIKRLLRWMWRRSEPVPDYLLLAGDASNDIAGHTVGSAFDPADTNFVPAMTVPGFSFGRNTEIITCDHWYVNELLDTWGEEMTQSSDMHLGRVPCGNTWELETFVEKVLAYETEDLTGTWRNRVVLHSDDTFSGDGNEYKHRRSEHSFRWISQESADWITEDSTFAHFDVELFYQSAIMDSVVSLKRCIPDPADTTRCLRDMDGDVVLDSLRYIPFVPSQEYGEEIGNGLLEASLSKGALIYAYQGHSHRKQMAHEVFFRLDDSRYNLHDVADLSNLEKPFVFVGAGCHLNEYAHHAEAGRRGDGVTEALLFCCPNGRRAAIASLASVTYETIGHDIEEHFFAALFNDPPRDEQEGARWRLGEVITQAMARNLNFRTQRTTYFLLGDPALRLGAAPPVMELELNGLIASAGGDQTVEFISDRDDDSLAVVIKLMDESQVALPRIKDFLGDTYDWVPDDLLQASSPGGDERHLTVRYGTQLQRRDYTLEIESRDYDGGLRTLAVQVPLTVVFYEQEGEELLPLADGSSVSTAAELVVLVRTGSHFAAEDVILLAGGTQLLQSAATLDEPPGEPMAWTLHYAPLSGVPDGPLDLDLQVAQRDPSHGHVSAAQVEVVVGDVALRFDSCQWIPNPFADETTLVYELSQEATRVDLRLYTVSGRRILSRENLPAMRGMRHHIWDGRDGDGDPVANGLYFFELIARDPDGGVADRMLDAVVRGR